MANTRLTQYGVGGQAYEAPVDIIPATAYWGWQGHAATVDYTEPRATRLGQIAVGVAEYPPEKSDVIGPITANWGWSAYPATVDYQDPQIVDATTGNWGWTAQQALLCSQYRVGYPYSFNGDVWPTCVFNDHVFGVRASHEIEATIQSWGWQPLNATVDFADPIDVTTSTGNWGWFGYPSAVSYAFDVQCTVVAWGWQGFNVTVELPYDIDATTANWGWFGYPTAVSYGYDIGAGVAAWGWQGQPATVDVPSQDVRCTVGNWGWQSFNADVRQTQMLPGDIDAIADAVYQKFVDEGVIQQILETWQRQGCDASYPQDIPPSPGQYIECGGMRIYVERLPDGKIRHTRQ